jgi:hypothetical protein
MLEIRLGNVRKQLKDKVIYMCAPLRGHLSGSLYLNKKGARKKREEG